jgi:hypothetical protein
MRSSPRDGLLVAVTIGLALCTGIAEAQVGAPEPPDGLVYRDPFIAETGSLTTDLIQPPDSLRYRDPFLGEDGVVDTQTLIPPDDLVYRDPFVDAGGVVSVSSIAPPANLTYRDPFISADGEVTVSQIEPPAGLRYRDPFLTQDGRLTAAPPGKTGAMLRMQSVVPNPFNPSTQITFRLESREDVDVEIFNAAGRRVRTLQLGVLPPDLHVVRWDGADDAGRSVASGVYMVRVQAGGVSVSAKATLVK